MRKPTIVCALLAAMIAKHKWGTPIDREHLLAIAAIKPDEYDRARESYDELRAESYITNRGDRGIELNNGAFGELADLLFSECGWEPFEIKLRLKHYEGWERHEWT